MDLDSLPRHKSLLRTCSTLMRNKTKSRTHQERKRPASIAVTYQVRVLWALRQLCSITTWWETLPSWSCLMFLYLFLDAPCWSPPAQPSVELCIFTWWDSMWSTLPGALLAIHAPHLILDCSWHSDLNILNWAAALLGDEFAIRLCYHGW